MSFEFRPAARNKTSTLIALAGPTGCGKTFTAILMAIGIAYPDMSNEQIIQIVREEGKSRVFFIDSEGGRGLHYAPGPGADPDFVETFPYQYGEITAPYTPERYQEAAEAAERAGAWVIIIDSASHEYESEGGVLEIADQIEAGTPKPGIDHPRDPFSSDGWKDWLVKPVKSPGNWNEPKTRHKKMMNRLIQLRSHVIFCLRAEEKMLMKMEPVIDPQTGEPRMGRNGPIKKSVIVPAEDRPLLERWQPICEKRFMFEMTCSFLLLPDRPGSGIPIKTLQGAFRDIFDNMGPQGQRLGRSHGEMLAHWSVGMKKGGERPQAGSSERSSGQAADEGQKKKPQRTPEQMVDAYEKKVRDCRTVEELQAVQMDAATAKWIDGLRTQHPDLHRRVLDINSERYIELTDPGDDTDAGEKPSGEDLFGGDKE